MKAVNELDFITNEKMNKSVILKFVNALNLQDLPLIIDMMSEDFCFIDTYGEQTNREQMINGWKAYFDWFPDYHIEIKEYIGNEDFSVILGAASGSYLGNQDKRWAFPAAWKVIVKREQIQLWQVFCDSKKQLDSLN